MSRCGLQNNGNECFINAAIQCLAISPAILGFISNYINEDKKMIELIGKYNLGKFKADNINVECKKILEENNNVLEPIEKHILSQLANHSEDIYIYISFKEIIKNINENRGVVLNNSRFLSIIKEITDGSGFEHLFSGEQNDPHEFMAYLFDKLHLAKKTKVKIDLPSNIEEINEYYKIYLKSFKTQYENNYSYFVKNLYYYILNCVECSKCKNKLNDTSPNDILSVSIPDNIEGNISLYDCLNNMFNTEAITYKCEKCGNNENNRIEKKILTKPKTLIIKIKRYELIGTTLRKINKMIEYPAILNSKDYYCGDDKDKCLYELYGIINHSGILNGGHYYSYIKDISKNGSFEKQWICCNDSRVFNITDENAMTSQNAYMLFYNLII